MDYIREELLRQQSALRLLMRGSEEPAGISDTEPDSPVKEKTIWTGGYTPAGKGLSAARLASRSGMRGGIDGEVPGTVQAETGGSARSGGNAIGAEPFSAGQSFLPETAWTVGNPGEHTVTELIWADGGASWDPREISRVFQRDARRYDGAFSADERGE